MEKPIEANSHPVLRSDREVLQHYLGDLVYGANDGIVTTFAVVAGVTGADLSVRIVVILGVANLLADGFSMGASNYLAIRSKSSAEREVGVAISEPYPSRHGLATFLAFIAAGSVPLLAYLVPGVEHNQFTVTAFLAAFTLFAIGSARSLLTVGSWWTNGFEMLMIGGAAGAVSYLVGGLVSQLTSHTP
jgi:VIT1/CCC1 family predicted Fe2+/Mn2+ transporter